MAVAYFFLNEIVSVMFLVSEYNGIVLLPMRFIMKSCSFSISPILLCSAVHFLLSASHACTNIMLTLVSDVYPLVEFALVRDAVELAALDGSEARLALRTCPVVTDLVSVALPKAVSPTVPRAEGHKRKQISLH